MTKSACVSRVLEPMVKKGESVLAPEDAAVRVVAVVKELEERNNQTSDCLLSALSDLAKHK